jgi:uncharacterized delta-60 repeat protein
MRKTIKLCWGITALLLLNDLVVGAAHSQTVDSLNVLIAGSGSSSAALLYTAIRLPAGKILAGGDSITFTSSGNHSHTNLVLLNSDGSVDDSFNLSIGSINCVAIQTNGQILVGGNFSTINGQSHYNLGRLNANGTLDTQFNAGYINNGLICTLVQPDGKILIGGAFTTVNSQSCSGLCRLNYDGSQDTGFNAGANGSVATLALQPDGKILVRGTFTSIGGKSRTNFARLNPDGSLDSSFQPVSFTTLGATGFAGFGGALLVQPDGKILVGGFFDTVNGLSHTNIVRFNANGTLDTNFNAQADLYDCWGLQTLTLQTDGKILVGDDSHTLNGHSCPYLGRLNADGSLDAGFSTNLVGGVMVFSSTLQSDGKILVGGWFNSLGGLSRNTFGRLINTDIAMQYFNYDGTNIFWQRGGTSPEVWRTSFESSTDGTNWIYLGEGVRVGSGWQLTNVSVSTNATLRARGFIAGGRCNGSSWFVESLCSLPTPRIVINDGCLGFRTNRFGFNLNGKTNSTVVIDASSTLLDWTPIATNILPSSGQMYFCDPCSTNFIRKFYRVRMQ